MAKLFKILYFAHTYGKKTCLDDLVLNQAILYETMIPCLVEVQTKA